MKKALIIHYNISVTSLEPIVFPILRVFCFSLGVYNNAMKGEN